MEEKIEALSYLQLLAISYPTIQQAATEYINLSAILNLPKATEHFLSDIHGEHDTFQHILQSGSGIIRSKIDQVFPSFSPNKKDFLATMIYYPREKLDHLLGLHVVNVEFYHELLVNLIEITKYIASKYTRSKVRKKISPDFAYIIEEVMQVDQQYSSKETYVHAIIDAIVATGRAKDFCIELCLLLQHLAVDHLHILGDIFDRGNGACRIMETLTTLPSVDITWGNHDLLYMGASAGNYACIANTIRNSCRYNHLSTLEDGYGISLRPLVTFAMKVYGDDECYEFIPKQEEANAMDDYDLRVVAKMHKAITIIQLKVEGQVLSRHSNYQANQLQKLNRIDFQAKTVRLEEKNYDLLDTFFPTIDPQDPFALSLEEAALMEKLAASYRHCEKLSRHVAFLLSHGSMYLRYNGNLLYHGCIPTGEDGSFLTYINRDGKSFQGKRYLDYCDMKVRKALLSPHPEQDDVDFLWFLWCCPLSPLYGKENIATFERYFLKEEESKEIKENKNPYYRFIEDVSYVDRILQEFKLDSKEAIIINGHMPVKIRKGESPIRAGGKLLIIDGGISKAYQKVTGIAGYTLTSSSWGLRLVAHQPFESKEMALMENKDIIHSITTLKEHHERLQVKDTDQGRTIQKRIDDLSLLLQAYRDGRIASK